MTENTLTTDRLDLELLLEGLDRAMLALQVEDRGWVRWMGWNGFEGDFSGLTLDQAKEAAVKGEEYATGHDLIKNGAFLRGGYVWGKGVLIEGADRPKGKTGSPTRLQKFVTDPVNQETLLLEPAQMELERTAFAEGTVLALGDNRSKQVRRFSVQEVTGVYTNPDFPEEVWAYQRTWNSVSKSDPSKTEPQTVWYYTYRCPLVEKKPFLGAGANRVRADLTKTLFDIRFNRLVGYPLGIPDCMAALPHAQEYSRFMNSGVDVTAAMASIIHKVRNNSRAGANNSAVKVASSTGSGNTASLGSGQDIETMSKAGQAYDFDKGRAIAARIAAALGVSLVHLLMDSGAAGSSYGSAQNLNAPHLRGVMVRQREWAAYLRTILRWATGESVEVEFPEIEDEPHYRQAQSLQLGWLSGNLHPSEHRKALLALEQIKPDVEGSPEGILIPNNEKSLARRDIDTDGAPTQTAVSPDQGRGNGAGESGDNDMRTDILSQSLMVMNQHALKEDVESLKEMLLEVLANIPRS